MSFMSGRTFIDTNIFLYCHDTADPGKRRIARDLVFREFKLGRCAVSTQVLAEFFNVFVVKMQKPYIDAVKELHFMCRCTVIEQTVAVLVTGSSIHSKYPLSFWDSMIVAAAVESSAETLYSEDLNHGQKIESITVVDPFL
jgi:predicted nucleic acid-binding protein